SARPDGSTSDLSSGGFCLTGDRAVAISGDNRFVALESNNFLLVPGFAPLLLGGARTYILVHDRVTGANEMASLGSDGTQPDTPSFGPSISSDGRFVAFESGASNLVPRDTNGGVFVHDRQTGTTELVGVAIDGSQADGGSWAGRISADGHWACFVSNATNLLRPRGDTKGHAGIFVRKLD